MINHDVNRTPVDMGRRHAPLLAVALSAALALITPRAKACGVSASGISSCSLAEHDEAERAHWAVGVSGLYTVTRLRFSGSLYADQVRYATLASLAYLPTPKLVLQAGAGVAFGGSLTLPDGKYQFAPGPTGVLGADYRIFDDARYFLVLTSGLSFAFARTRLGADPSIAYEAFDLRVGAQLGLELGRVFRPYVLGRVFGGPVFWRHQGVAVDGTDTHHYQFGIGASGRLAKTLSVFAEGVPFGERAVSLGVGLAL